MFKLMWRVRDALLAIYKKKLEDLKKNPLPRPKDISKVYNRKIFGEKSLLKHVKYFMEYYRHLAVFEVKTEKLPKYSP